MRLPKLTTQTKSLNEASPLSLAGSFLPGLMQNKLWLCVELAKLKKNFSDIFVLGSWYGNISLIINKLNYFDFDRIINVELDKHCQNTGAELAKSLELDMKIHNLNQDVNKLRYRHKDPHCLIINNSCNDIKKNLWFDNIPAGTMIALQGRNNLPKAAHEYHNLRDFKMQFQLSNIEFAGEREFTDPETDYRLFMVIGRK